MGDISNFDKNAKLWAQYSNSVKGLIREEVIWHNLERALPAGGKNAGRLRALDAGCGAGGIGVRLALAGFDALLLDSSPKMLAEAKKRAEALGAEVSLCCAHLEKASNIFPQGSFNLISCHSVLEFVDEPGDLLIDMAGLLSEGGRLSLVCKNRYSEPLHRAILRCDIEGAICALERSDFEAELFGLKGKAFSQAELKGLVAAAGLSIIGGYGVRVIADFVHDDKKNEPLFFKALLDLEKRLSSMQSYREMARYIHLICAKPAA